MQSRDMQQSREKWIRWVESLDKWGLRGLTAWVLEAAGPLSVLGAQVVYLGQPFLRSIVSDDGLSALAHMLEDRDEKQAFVSFLREASSP